MYTDSSVVSSFAQSWQTTVPLNDGTNAITATFEGANASVTVTRIQVFVVSGRVFMQGTGVGLTSPDVLVARTDPGGSSSIVARLDLSGNYAFTGLLAGSYTISPRLTPPESPSCLAFTPATRTVDVTTADVPGQDFAAATASPCYSIRGQVTASNNPGFGVKDIDVFIKDSMETLSARLLMHKGSTSSIIFCREPIRLLRNPVSGDLQHVHSREPSRNHR
jgi:hypothetical protein